MLPKLQISATQSYPISCITSGAIQYGVPITVLRFAIVSCKNYAVVNGTMYKFKTSFYQKRSNLLKNA